MILKQRFDAKGELVLAALWAIVFFPLLNHPFFTVDDAAYVLNNPMVLQGLSRQGLQWSVSSLFYGYLAPITWLSHALDVEFYGLWAGGHHLTSALIHLAATLIVLRAAERFTGDRQGSLFVAALFLFHPLQIEAVAWVAIRKDILAGLFFWLSILFYLRYSEKLLFPFYLLSLAAFALGLMSKLSVVSLPAVLFLIDFWPNRRFSRKTWKSLIYEKLPYILIAAPLVHAGFSAQKSLGALDIFPPPLTETAAELGGNVVFYLKNFLLPFWLAFPYPDYHLASAPSRLYLPLVGLISLFWVLRAGRSPQLCFGWFFFILCIFPFLQTVRAGLQTVTDHWMYIPGFGLSFALYFAVTKLPCSPAIKKALLAFLVCGCFFISIGQIRLWKSSAAMLDYAAQTFPANASAKAYLVPVYRALGDNEKALQLAKQAASDDPHLFPAFQEMVALLADNKDFERLFALADCACEGEPRSRYACSALKITAGPELRGDAPARAARLFIEAKECLEQLRSSGQASRTINGLYAKSLWESGDRALAIKLLEENTAAGKGVLSDISTLAAYCQEEGDLNKAASYYRLAIWANPIDAGNYLALAGILKKERKPSEARNTLLALLTARPEDRNLLLALADIEMELDQKNSAKEYLKTALKLYPGDMEALKGLEYLKATESR